MTHYSDAMSARRSCWMLLRPRLTGDVSRVAMNVPRHITAKENAVENSTPPQNSTPLMEQYVRFLTVPSLEPNTRKRVRFPTLRSLIAGEPQLLGELSWIVGSWSSDSDRVAPSRPRHPK